MRFISTILFLVTAECRATEILQALKIRHKKDKIVKPSEWVHMIEQTNLDKSFQVVFF